MKPHVGYTLLVLVIIILLSVTVFSGTSRQIPGAWLSGTERPSPGNWVGEEQIKVYPNQVVVEMPQVFWASFTDTNSMDPLLDEQANALEIKPAHPDSIAVGDVISYRTAYGTIIHRVVEKGSDEQGIYYRAKGDNNTIQDPLKIRFDDVQGVVVAVIY